MLPEVCVTLHGVAGRDHVAREEYLRSHVDRVVIPSLCTVCATAIATAGERALVLLLFFETPDTYSRRVMDSESGSTPTTSQFAQLMEAISASQERMDSKLAEFRDELQKSQEDAASKALKRVCHERPYSFRRKGNEEQATFNERVEEAGCG